jgi:prepilin-type N-terminal cleavage/methylation domain-containing protein
MVRTDAGFTLGELLVVVIIIGILSAIAIPMYINQRRQAEKAVMKQLAHDLGTAFEAIALEDDWLSWPGVNTQVHGPSLGTIHTMSIQYMGTEIYMGGNVTTGSDAAAWFAARPGLEAVMTEAGWWLPSEGKWLWQKTEATTEDLTVSITIENSRRVKQGTHPATQILVMNRADFVNKAVRDFDRNGDGRLMSPSPEGPYYDEFTNFYAAAWGGWGSDTWAPRVTYQSGRGVQ